MSFSLTALKNCTASGQSESKFFQVYNSRFQVWPLTVTLNGTITSIHVLLWKTPLHPPGVTLIQNSSPWLAYYIILIRSVLGYACTVWHSSPPQYLSKVEQVQKHQMWTANPLSFQRGSFSYQWLYSSWWQRAKKFVRKLSTLCYPLLPSTRGRLWTDLAK